VRPSNSFCCPPAVGPVLSIVYVIQPLRSLRIHTALLGHVVGAQLHLHRDRQTANTLADLFGL